MLDIDTLAKIMCRLEGRHTGRSFDEVVQPGIELWTRHRYEAEQMLEELQPFLSAVPQHDLNTEQADRVDALSAAPVEGDREALIEVIAEYQACGSCAGAPEYARWCGDCQAEADAILAAGFSRSPLPVEGEVECKHKNTHMRGWTQVCDDCGLGREL